MDISYRVPTHTCTLEHSPVKCIKSNWSKCYASLWRNCGKLLTGIIRADMGNYHLPQTIFPPHQWQHWCGPPRMDCVLYMYSISQWHHYQPGTWSLSMARMWTQQRTIQPKPSQLPERSFTQQLGHLGKPLRSQKAVAEVTKAISTKAQWK